MSEKLLVIITWLFLTSQGVPAQNIQISFPDISAKKGVYTYLLKPYGLKMDTVARSEFINGICTVTCKGYPQGLYRLNITGIEAPVFLLLGNNNITMKYEQGKNSLQEPVFQNSPTNAVLQEILHQNEQYHAGRDTLSQAAQTIFEFDPHYKSKLDSVRIAYDNLHEEHNAILDDLARQTSDEYLLKTLIPLLKFTSYTKDADKVKYDNDRSYQHYEFFKKIDFSQKQLAGDFFYAKKLNEYISYFGGRSSTAKQESCQMLVKASKANQDVQRFTVEVLMEIYFDMKDYAMVEYIGSLVSSESCEAPRLSGELQQYVAQSAGLQPGKTAPDISMKDPSGKYQVLSLTAQAHKNTVVLFWASWCPHCLELISRLKSVYPELKARNVEIFAVSLDENNEDWVGTLAENDIGWVNVSERRKWETQAVKDYNVRSTPTLFLLAGDMKILGRYHSFEDMKSALWLN